MALKPLDPQPVQRIRLKVKPPPAPLDNRWRPSWLLAAPHRLAFFSAAVMLSFSAIWWSALLLARTLNLDVPWAFAPAGAHAMLMTFGFMPLFFAGFLFTAGPKWLNRPPVPARQLLPYVAATLLGWLLCICGLHWASGLAATGMALVALAWSWLVLRFTAMWHASRAADKVHATVVVYAIGLGAVAMWVVALGLLNGQQTLVRIATQGALWLFIATTFAAVSHRMIPFFSASALPVLDAWHPQWLLWSMVTVLWFEGASACMEILGGNIPDAVRWLQVAIEAPAAGLMLWLAIRWGLVQSLKIRLLAMLHGGFVWLGVALTLQAASHTLTALHLNSYSLGLAPLHAMTMGYLGATMFAMTTRVASGHGGRPVAADNTAWYLYWILQTAVVLRVLSAIWLSIGSVPLLLAATAWTLATCGWALRYGNWFGRPRPDGRPG